MKRKKLWWLPLAAVLVLVVALVVGIRGSMRRAYERQHAMDAWRGVKRYAELTNKLGDAPIVLPEETELGLADDVVYGLLMDGPEDDRHAVGYSATGMVAAQDEEPYRQTVEGGPRDLLGAPAGNVLSEYRGAEIHSRRIFLQVSVDGKTRREVITAIELDGYIYRASITYYTLDITPEALQAQEAVLEQKNVELLQKIVDQYMDRP